MGNRPPDSFDKDPLATSMSLAAVFNNENKKLKVEVERLTRLNEKYEQALKDIKPATSVIYGLEYSGFDMFSRLDDAYQIATRALENTKI